MLTERKVFDHYRAAAAQKRGRDSASASTPEYAVLDSAIACREPDPEFVAAFNESLARALSRLEEPNTREVAIMRMEGYENREIADCLQISLSSVERKLRVIREVWEQEFA